MKLSFYDDRRGPRMSRRILRGFNPATFSTVRKSHYTVAELARLSGVGMSTIHAWEAGRGTPQVHLLARVMQLLQTPIEQVIDIKPAERFPGDWRIIRGLTQPELAAAAKIATGTLSTIENGTTPLAEANADKLASLLGITATEYRAAYERARTRPPGTPA